MDPLSIFGLVLGIQQIVNTIYQYAQGAIEAKNEINKLCSELFALKAALEHVQLNQDTKSLKSNDMQIVLSSSNFGTPEFAAMIASTDEFLRSLMKRLNQRKNGTKFNHILRSATWPLDKKDIVDDIQRLERLKSFFVLATTSDNLVLCKRMYNMLCSMDDRLQNQENAIEIKRKANTRSAIINWLASQGPESFLQRSLGELQPDTGTWFLDHYLQDWLDGIDGKDVLWLRAKPGSGKTTLMSAAITKAQEHMAEHPKQKHLAYFFCSFTNQATQDVSNVLGSLLVQLCDAFPKAWQLLEAEYLARESRSFQEAKKLHQHEIQNLLAECASAIPKIYIMIDAISGIKEASQVLNALSGLLRQDNSVKIMFSSTEELTHLPFDEDRLNIVEINKSNTGKDIEKYVDSWLTDNENLCELPESLKEEIRSQLLQKHDGVFRWVRCQMESLANQVTVQAFRDALRNVPDSLEQTYTDILNRIPSGIHRKLAKQTLFWLAFSLGPMTLVELSEACLVEDEEVDLVISEDVRLLQKDTLLKLCGSLIKHDMTSHTVSIAHSSVIGFLTSPTLELNENDDLRYFHLDKSTAGNSIIARCIKYMMLPAFSSGVCKSEAALKQRRAAWPLLTYIAETLFIHLKHVQLTPRLKELLFRFFETHETLPGGGNFGAWVQAFKPGAGDNIENSGPLYYASRFGQADLVKLILEREGTKSLELPGGRRSSSPLQVASWTGHPEVVRILLDAGSDPNSCNALGLSNLAHAVVFEYIEIEQMLKRANATLNDRDREYIADWRRDRAQRGIDEDVGLTRVTSPIIITDPLCGCLYDARRTMGCRDHRDNGSGKDKVHINGSA